MLKVKFAIHNNKNMTPYIVQHKFYRIIGKKDCIYFVMFEKRTSARVSKSAHFTYSQHIE